MVYSSLYSTFGLRFPPSALCFSVAAGRPRRDEWFGVCLDETRERAPRAQQVCWGCAYLGLPGWLVRQLGLHCAPKLCGSCPDCQTSCKLYPRTWGADREAGPVPGLLPQATVRSGFQPVVGESQFLGCYCQHRPQRRPQCRLSLRESSANTPEAAEADRRTLGRRPCSGRAWDRGEKLLSKVACSGPMVALRPQV